MEITIKSLNGNTLTFFVLPHFTILELQKQIEKEEGISTNQQKLVYMGKILSDNKRTLESYKIENGHCLHLAVSLRGGGGFLM